MTPIDDEVLTKSLACLTAADVPDGFEQRILARLAARAASQPRGARHLFEQARHQLASIRPQRPLLATTAALAALAVVMGGLRHRAPHPPTHTVSLRLRSIAESPVPLLPLPEAQRAPSLTTSAQPALSQAHGLAPTIAASTPDEAVTDAERALAELHAPSQLAPPLPLTDDERALQHLAQHTSPDTLNALNSDHRNAAEAEDQAAFVAFFTPPTPPHNELKGASE